MDKCASGLNITDAEFDSYWDYEAKNKNRNRIRVGRQYQASIPPLLKPGEKDARRSEDLETLKWKPDQIDEQQIDKYLSMARAVALFSKSIEYRCNHEKSTNPLQTAFKGLSEFLVSHHPTHHDAGCKVPAVSSSSPSSTTATTSATATSDCELASKLCSASDWTTPEAHLFAQAVEACGKNFCAIKKEYLPWKPVRSLIEYYYQNGKNESNATDSVPIKCCNVKMESGSEAVASCSSSSCPTGEVTLCDTKDEITSEVVEQKAEVLATTASNKNVSEVKQEVLQTDCCKSSPATIQSTVGSLKFFLGGRLVLKLNAKQNGGTGTPQKCQWVQSHDTPKHLNQTRKMKHRKKIFQDSLVPVTAEGPKVKKRAEDSLMASAVSSKDSTTMKTLKLRTFEPESSYPPLCRGSWTPPVADGHDSVDMDDCSSKTSEGCGSPIVLPSRCKAEVKTEIFSDSKMRLGEESQELKYDRKHIWIKNEPCSSHSQSNHNDEFSPQVSGSFQSEKSSPKSLREESSYSHEVLNHRSALVHKKNLYYAPRAAHSSSPSTKQFRKLPSPSVELLEQRGKSTRGIQSPSSMTSSTTYSDSSNRDYVLNLSGRSERCESRDSTMGPDCCCQSSPKECCELNCTSSLEASLSMPCTSNTNAVCCKSSDCNAYPIGVPETKNKGHSTKSVNEQRDSSGTKERTDAKTCGIEDQCSCCYNPSTSCASPKCCKNFSSKEHSCNSEDRSDISPSFGSPNSVRPATDESYSKNNVPWYGTPVTSLLPFYPQCYQYYVAYGVNSASPTDSSGCNNMEIPLDLSSNGTSKEDIVLPDNIPDGEAELQKATGADALDRGMLYQLLKNKINK